MVSTHLKNISQIGSFLQIGVNIKNIWNHHLVLFLSTIISHTLDLPRRMQSLPPEWCNPKLNLHLQLESWLGGSWRITPLSSHLGPFSPGELLTIVANYLLNGMIFQVVPTHTQQQTLISPTKKHALWAQRTHLDCSTRTMVAQLLGSLQGILLLVFGSCDRQLFHQQRSWNMNYQPKQGHYVFSKKFVRPWSFATFLHQVFFFAPQNRSHWMQWESMTFMKNCFRKKKKMER